MAELVERVVFEPDRGRWGPFGVFLSDPLDSRTAEAELLAPPELGDQRPIPVRVADHGPADVFIGASIGDDEVAREDHHGAVAFAFTCQIEDDGAALAFAAAVAVAVVDHVCVAVAGVEGDEAEAVGDEFVGEDGGVAQHLDLVDGDGGDFGEDSTAEGVG